MNREQITDYNNVEVDFRNQLKSRFSPFIMEANRFIVTALGHFDTIKDNDKKNALALKITNDWLDLLNMRDVVDLGFMPSKSEMAGYTGLSLEEVLMLEATVYAENLGLDITPLEKAAVHHNIYGRNFPGRNDNDAPHYPYQGNLRGDPSP